MPSTNDSVDPNGDDGLNDFGDDLVGAAQKKVRETVEETTQDRPVFAAGLSTFDDYEHESAFVRLISNFFHWLGQKWFGFWGGIGAAITGFWGSFCQCRLWRWSAAAGILSFLMTIGLAISWLLQGTNLSAAMTKPTVSNLEFDDPMVPAQTLTPRTGRYRILERSGGSPIQFELSYTEDPRTEFLDNFVANFSDTQFESRMPRAEDYRIPSGWQRDRGPRDAGSFGPVESYANTPGVRVRAEQLAPLATPDDRPSPDGQSGSDIGFDLAATWPREVGAGEPVIVRIDATNTSRRTANAARLVVPLFPLDRVVETDPPASVVEETLVWTVRNWAPGERRTYQIAVVPDNRGFRAEPMIQTAAAVSAVSEVAQRTPSRPFDAAPVEPSERMQPAERPSFNIPYRDPGAPTVDPYAGGDLLPDDEDAGGLEGEMGGFGMDVRPGRGQQVVPAGGPMEPAPRQELRDDRDQMPADPFGLYGGNSAVPVQPLDMSESELPDDPVEMPENLFAPDPLLPMEPIAAGRTTLEVSVTAGPVKPDGGRPFRIQIRNTGTRAAEAVELLVRLPSTLSHPAGRELVLDSGRIEPGQSFPTQLTTRVVGADVAAVTATVTAANADEARGSASVDTRP